MQALIPAFNDLSDAYREINRFFALIGGVKAYDAAFTPDIYLFDANLRLAFRGQLDGSRPGNDIPVTGVDLRNALDAVLEGQEVSGVQKPSLGCNIKWKN